MKELGIRTLVNTEHLHTDWSLVREYPLSEHLLAMSRVWEHRDGADISSPPRGRPRR